MSAAILAIAWAYALYVLFLAYVALRVAKNNGKLAATPWPVRIVAWSIIVLAGLVDVGFNVTIGSIVFLELPSRATLTFSARCSFHMADLGWRGRIARWVCNGWLNPMEAGHCS